MESLVQMHYNSGSERIDHEEDRGRSCGKHKENPSHLLYNMGATHVVASYSTDRYRLPGLRIHKNDRMG